MNRLIIRVVLALLVLVPVTIALLHGCSARAPHTAGIEHARPIPTTPAATPVPPPTAEATRESAAPTFNLQEPLAANRPAIAPAPVATVAPPGMPAATADGANKNVAEGEELWVIERQDQFRTKLATDPKYRMRGAIPQQQRATGESKAAVQDLAALPAPAAEPEIPGTGCLVAKLPDKLVPVPLKHTDVKGSIAGYVATVDVTQQYHNPYAEKIEAVYVFPLPTNAAVNDFLMTIGDRKIRGIIREREEAKRIYESAKRQGHVASLLTQERPNIFTQSVANIEPGKAIDVNIKYFHTLEYVDGSYEFVFPMIVGPRFNPPGFTDGIGAKPHEAPAGATGQKTEVSYLKPNERSGHDISLSLDVDAGVKVEEIKSVNHQVKLDRPGDHLARITLESSDSIPNKDFVLRYKVAGKTVKSAIMAQRDEKNGGGYFTLMLFPPESLESLPRKPLELVFTLDVSGSMSGQPLKQAKSAITYALEHMDAKDTFNVIRFAGNADQMSPRAVPADRENIKQALRYIEGSEAGGGTMMIEGIRRSLQVTPEPERLRFVAFLTDGYIGNEAEILGEIHNLRGPTRIFSFGVGSSTNRYLLDHMAKMGQGCAAYLSLNEDGGKVMADYFERISHPALTDLSIDWGGMQVSEVYPAKLPDLFVGRPVVITGRYTGAPDAATVRVHGKVNGEQREMALKLDASDAANQHKGIAPVWARAKIADIGDRATYENNAEFPDQIKQVALEYGLMSAYTSFVAVDSSIRTAGDHGTTVAVPVPMPQGVKYETTVPE